MLQFKDTLGVVAENLHQRAVSKVCFKQHSNHRPCIEPVEVGGEEHSADADFTDAVREVSVMVEVSRQVHADVVMGTAHLDGLLVAIDPSARMPEDEAHIGECVEVRVKQ